MREFRELKEVEEETRSSAPTLILFTAPWCKPCEEMYRELSKMAGVVTEVKIYVIDLSKHPEAALKYSVINVPTLIIFKDGKPTIRKVGFIKSEELQSLILRITGDMK